MGFLDSLKGMAKKAKCATGFHAGVFRKVDGEPECYREKTCPDCGEKVTEHKHSYPETHDVDYNEAGSCDKTLICAHCGFKRNITVHESFNIVGTNGRCEGIEKCFRCKLERNSGESSHSWGREDNNPDGTVNYKCYNCGTIERRSY